MKIFKSFRTGAMIIIVLVIIAFSSSFWGTVGAGERGILLRFGAVTGKVFDEGLYFKIPLVEQVKIFDVKVQKDETSSSAASKDLQTVTSEAALNFHLAPKQVAAVYQEVGTEYKYRLIDPAVPEAVKAGTAKYTAEELITKREEVRDDIKNLLKNKLEPRGIVIDEFNIINFAFSSSFNAAIEAKVTAEQRALEAKNKLEEEKYKAQQNIEQAKGRAEAIRIEAEALAQNKDLLELRAIEKWDGVLPVTMAGGAVPFLNLTNE